jgi:hypothetical protein
MSMFKRLSSSFYFSLIVYICSSLIVEQTFAQNQKFVINNITLTENGRKLHNGFCGGINSPIISEINLNNDAYPDLFLFDKYGDKPLTFINQGPGKYPTYIYEPAYESLFPKDLWAWAMIVDFNKDGIPDIFGLHQVYNGRAIGCYKGSYQNGQLRFDEYSPELQYDFNGFRSRMWSFKDDLPAFADVNNDGDLDALIFNNAGGSSLEYYENQSIESGYNLDSLNFLLVDLCWGKFIENSLDNSITTNYCKMDGGGLEHQNNSASRHQGGTIFAFDYEGDNDVDILMGDVSFSTLVFARNDGDSLNAHVLYHDSIFPVYDIPVNMPLCPGAFPIDYNNDGPMDLMIAPFSFSTQVGPSLDFSNIMIYENKKTPGLQEYTYKGDTFFVNQIFDLGTTSRAIFHDVDKDGKLDILVGLSGKFRPAGSPIAQLAYIRNTSTTDSIKFNIENRNWCNLEQFNLNGLYPAIRDLDGDNLPDLVMGDNYGFIHFLKNNGTANPYTAITTTQFGGIDVGSNATPFIFDLNSDGLNDIIVGNEVGRIQYYWNCGTNTQPVFNTDSSNIFLGNIRVNDWRKPITTGNATPTLYSENGKTYLMSGSERGIIFKYLINTDSLRRGSFELIDSNFINSFYDAATSIPGERNAIAVADLNNDGKLDYLMSGIRGGIRILSDSNWNQNPTIGINEIQEEFLFIYPNPAANNITVQYPMAQPKDKINIYDLNGRIVHSSMANSYNQIDISNLISGTYILRLTTQNSVISKKVMVIK